MKRLALIAERIEISDKAARQGIKPPWGYVFVAHHPECRAKEYILFPAAYPIRVYRGIRRLLFGCWDVLLWRIASQREAYKRGYWQGRNDEKLSKEP